MRKLIIPLIVLLVACDKDDPELICIDRTPDSIQECVTEVNVSSDQCILIESRQVNGFFKYVYYHDGVKYDSVERYEDQEGGLKLQSTYYLTYNRDGMFSEVKQRFVSGGILNFLFAYEEPVMAVRIYLQSVENEIAFDYTTLYLYVPNSPDTLYNRDYSKLYPGSPADNIEVHQYEQGNFIRGYQYNEEGTCEFQNNLFSLNGRYYYDSRPNVLTQEVLLGSSYDYSFFVSFDNNNYIGAADGIDDPVFNCFTVLTNGGGDYWLKSTDYVEYIYDCE